MKLSIKTLIIQLSLSIFYFAVSFFGLVLSFLFNVQILLICFIGLTVILGIIKIIQCSKNINQFLKIRDELEYKNENNIELTQSDKLRILGKVMEIKKN